MLLDLKPTKTNLPYRIPPWLLPLIFNQLSRADIVECAQVCRAWYRASHDPTLSYKWAYLEFTHFEMPLSRRQLRKRGWKRDVEVEKVASETQLTEGMIECGIMRSGVQLRRLSLGIDARNGNMENGYPCLSESLLTRMFERHRDRMSRLVELSVNVHNAYVDRLLFLLENDPSFLPNLSRLHIGNLDLWPLGTHETVQNLVTFRGLVTDIATCSCCQTIRWGFDTGIDTCSNCQKSYCYDCRYIGPKRCGGYFDCEVQLCQACVILPEVGAKRSGGYLAAMPVRNLGIAPSAPPRSASAPSATCVAFNPRLENTQPRNGMAADRETS
ncbi:hypothetical protein HK097_006836 [Rhizophlyctis rosea]|uniref:F-box domain-containing protein n=1 Tax=Rhizophlyctis rosea TaxID=64517 RepID=A0AAD5SDW9_9FUNG|nr:hypothetical protein HK097_006836 [Rhizophlyctis rosea]